MSYTHIQNSIISVEEIKTINDLFGKGITDQKLPIITASCCSCCPCCCCSAAVCTTDHDHKEHH